MVLVPSLSNAVFTAVLEGIEDAIGSGNYQLLIGNTRYSDAEEEKLLGIYLQSNPDGILLSSLSQSARVTRMPAWRRASATSPGSSAPRWTLPDPPQRTTRP